MKAPRSEDRATEQRTGRRRRSVAVCNYCRAERTNAGEINQYIKAARLTDDL